MKLLLLLTLVLGGFSLPAHASKELDRCDEFKLTKSQYGYFFVRRLSTGAVVAHGSERDYVEGRFEELCSD